MDEFKRQGYLLFAILFAVIHKGGCRISCLTCDDIALPNLCTTIERCGDHEICGIEQYLTDIGSVRYRQRCIDRLYLYMGYINTKKVKRVVKRLQQETFHHYSSLSFCSNTKRSIIDYVRADRSSGLTICTECCDTELCNSGGCRQKGFADDFIGHICYSCDTQIGADMCNEIQQCGRDQICSIEPRHIPGAPDNLFRTSCTHPISCEAPTIIGRKRSGHRRCCNGTLCNMFDPGSGPTVSVTTTKASNIVSTQVASQSTSLPLTTGTPATTHLVSNSPSTVTQVVYTTTQVVSTVTQVVTTMKPTTKLPATSQACSGTVYVGCTDEAATCPDVYCKETVYRDWACKNCRKSCGFCSAATSAPLFDCKDKVPGCTALHCRDPRYQDFAKESCQLTCGKCTERASAEEPGNWLMMLKAVPGKRPDIYDLWQRSGSFNSHTDASHNLLNTFHGQFKSKFSDTWDNRKIDKVTVAMYIKGIQKAFITFNATGQDKLSWFSADRVINSTWSTSLHGQFQMKRDSGTGFEFNAEHQTDGADPCNSSGWMLITTDSLCIHDSSLVNPSLLFCPHTNLPCRWKDGIPIPLTVGRFI